MKKKIGLLVMVYGTPESLEDAYSRSSRA
ncbi:Protein of unknown function [Bacillus mycoides]|nr:Protein of unknown function [Bacillus mycoides]